MEGKIKKEEYVIRRIEELTNLTYIGLSKFPIEESNDNWIVKKIEVNSGLTKISYAVGSWTNRASLIFV